MVGRTVGIIYAEFAQGDRSLRSVFRQKTPFDRIIYIDDGIESSIEKKGIEYHKSQKKLGFLHHLYTTVHQLEDEDIVVLMNGGDELAHDKVIGDLKTLYDEEGIWITYGGGMHYPAYIKNQMKEIPVTDILRKNSSAIDWKEGHMKSFYARVFKKINITHFLSEGVFVKDRLESLFMLPMLEISEEKGRFLFNTHYLYNSGLNCLYTK
jgi:hypothetical protein